MPRGAQSGNTRASGSHAPGAGGTRANTRGARANTGGARANTGAGARDAAGRPPAGNTTHAR